MRHSTTHLITLAAGICSTLALAPQNPNMFESLSLHEPAGIPGRDVNTTSAFLERRDHHHNGLNDNSRLGCYRDSHCSNREKQTCRDGYKPMGWDTDYCDRGKHEAKSICCKNEYVDHIPRNQRCEWRTCGDTGRPGDIIMFKSGNGGHPLAEHGDLKQCRWGYKYFVCPLLEFRALTQYCRWTPTVKDPSCGGNEVEYAMTKNGDHLRSLFCCERERGPSPLSNCHWVGKGRCDDNTCNHNEVILQANVGGDNGNKCKRNHVNGSPRHKSLCCTPHIEALDGRCLKSACALDDSLCSAEDWGEPVAKDNHEKPQELVLEFKGLEFRPRPYPSATRLKDATLRPFKHAFKLNQDCHSSAIQTVEEEPLTPVVRRLSWVTEHPVELEFVIHLIKAAIDGVLPSGRKVNSGTIPKDVIATYFLNSTLKSAITPMHRSKPTKIPAQAVFECLGSFENREPLMLVDKALNGLKKRIFALDGGVLPISDGLFTHYLEEAIKTGINEELVLEPIRGTIGVWRYLHHEDVQDRIAETRTRLQVVVRAISYQVPELELLRDLFDEVEQDFWDTGAAFTKVWVTDRIKQVRDTYAKRGQEVGNWPVVRKAMDRLELEVHTHVKTMPKINW